MSAPFTVSPKAECCIESHDGQQGQRPEPEGVDINLLLEQGATSEARQHSRHPNACFQQGHSDSTGAAGANISHGGKASGQEPTEIAKEGTKDAAQYQVADVEVQLNHKDGQHSLEQQAEEASTSSGRRPTPVTPGAQQGGQEKSPTRENRTFM